MRRLSFAIAASLAVLGVEAEDVSYFAVPPGAGPHDVAPAADGTVWYTAQRQGALGRLDPKTGHVQPSTGVWRSWKLPGEKPGAYAVYVDENDRVWLTDFAANAILCFEPVSERFTSFPSDRPSANVRQMLGRKGEVWGAESGTDRLVRVRSGAP